MHPSSRAARTAASHGALRGRRRRVSVVFACGALAAVSCARADECSTGAWRGTLGNDHVSLLLDTIGADGELAGRYYRDGEFVDHLLLHGPKGEPWTELQADTATDVQVTLACAGDTLTGERRAGSASEPLRAARIASEVFDDARFADGALVQTNDTFAITHGFARLSHGDIEAVSGLRLAGTEAGLARINARLAADFRTSIATALACSATGRLRGSDENIYYFAHDEAPIAWTSDYVVVSVDESGYCGGAHPYFGTTGVTYALGDGERENVGSWLDERYREELAKDSELGQLVMSRYLGDSEDAGEDCRTVVTLPTGGGALWPQADGLVFQVEAPYVASGCIEDIVVPWADVRPFLSTRGRAAAASFEPSTAH